MLVVFLTSLTGYGTFVYWYMNNQHNNVIKLAQTVGLVLGQDIAKLVLLNDVSAAADITSQLKSFQNLDSMVLFNVEKKALFQYSKKNKSFKTDPLPSKENRKLVINKDKLKFYIDANYQQTHIGYVELNFNIDTLIVVIQRDIGTFLLILVFMILISSFLALHFAKKFTTPILNLVRFLEKIDLLDHIDSRIQTKEENEYGRLYDEVNTMLERLESSHEALKIAATAFETQSGMAITDKNQNILRVNKAFSQITGYEPSEVIGKTPSILKSGKHDASFYLGMHDSLKENLFWMGEITNSHKDGKLVNEHLTIQAVLGENNDVKYYVASFLDITKQKNIEAELSEKKELLIQQTKMAQMGEMLENIAHQWRQPLSAITASASGIKMQKEFEILTDDDLVTSMDTIVKSAIHLSQTIDDFRDFYKDDKIAVSFNIQNSIDKTITLLSSKLKNIDLNIVLNIDSCSVFGFENELIQVFMNILNNAKDEFENQDEEIKLILISTELVENNIIVSFQDSAKGIPSNIINKIFDRKFTTKGNEEGTGIGLYMTKTILEKMSGDISVSNEEFIFEDKMYKGAQFQVTIPLIVEK